MHSVNSYKHSVYRCYDTMINDALENENALANVTFKMNMKAIHRKASEARPRLNVKVTPKNKFVIPLRMKHDGSFEDALAALIETQININEAQFTYAGDKLETDYFIIDNESIKYDLSAYEDLPIESLEFRVDDNNHLTTNAHIRKADGNQFAKCLLLIQHLASYFMIRVKGSVTRKNLDNRLNKSKTLTNSQMVIEIDEFKYDIINQNQNETINQWACIDFEATPFSTSIRRFSDKLNDEGVKRLVSTLLIDEHSWTCEKKVINKATRL